MNKLQDIAEQELMGLEMTIACSYCGKIIKSGGKVISHGLCERACHQRFEAMTGEEQEKIRQKVHNLVIT